MVQRGSKLRRGHESGARVGHTGVRIAWIAIHVQGGCKQVEVEEAPATTSTVIGAHISALCQTCWLNVVAGHMRDSNTT
jgi:hypothetical protein